jgi:hypothetical protein
LYLPPPCSSQSFSLLFSLSLLILSQIPNQMEISNINHEDKYNDGNFNIPLATSSLERKMLEYIAAQTQVLQAMAQTMVKIHQSITEQAPLPKAHNTVTNDNHQNMTPPPFDKEKLSVGDSPRGPLKQLGNPHIKTRNKPKPNTPRLTMQDTAHAAEAPNGPPRRPTRRSPRERLRLARGCAPPSGGLCPARGGALTSGGLRLARGSAPPSNGVCLARGRSARARLLPYAGI